MYGTFVPAELCMYGILGPAELAWTLCLPALQVIAAPDQFQALSARTACVHLRLGARAVMPGCAKHNSAESLIHTVV